MNTVLRLFLKGIRKIHQITHPDTAAFGRNWKLFSNKDYANDLIYKRLIADEPCMIARFGSTEMLCLTNYLGVKHRQFKSYGSFIKWQSPPWWWEDATIQQMQQWSGFFPAKIEKIEQFCKLMLNDISQVDILASWLKQERFFQKELVNSKRVVLEDMEPFFSSCPWTRALEGKKVLIVHPFAETIEHQYQKRELLFENNLLPQFELKTIKAVQSIAGEKTPFADWFEALDYMKQQIDATDYDICIIGAGAYGLPLAAHVKRQGKKAIHLAGVTQLLFGIIGRRWDQFYVWPYQNLFNEHWTRPNASERPQNADIVERACYW